MLPTKKASKKQTQISDINLFAGGHFWYPLSSKSKMLSPDTIRVLKFGSWATSAGHADWYAMETISPKFKGDFSNLAVFVVYKVSLYKQNIK